MSQSLHIGKTEEEDSDNIVTLYCCPLCHPSGKVSVREASFLEVHDPFDGYVTCQKHGRFYYFNLQDVPKITVSVVYATVEEEGVFIDAGGNRHPLSELEEYKKLLRKEGWKVF